MKIRILNALLVATLALTFAGCGGGGGGDDTSDPTAHNIISGVASKGIIRNGTVTVFALDADGIKGALLATAPTDADGKYSADVGAYTGAVLVEASGSYTDEKTGATVTILPTAPLRAAFDNVTSNVTVAVTPLTELAVQKAGTTLTPANIQAANALVSDLFNVDIIGTEPVEPVTSALQSATQAQQAYTLALAAISQMADTPTIEAVIAVVTTINSDIADGTMPAATAATFTSALGNFLASGSNQTGATTAPTELANVGTKTAVVKLSVAGLMAAAIYGVDVTIDLPTGVTVQLADAATGQVADSALVLSGVAAGGSFAFAKYTAATPATVRISLISDAGFGAGEFVTLNCDIAPGTTVVPADFSVEPGAAVINEFGIPTSASVTASVAI